MYDRYDMIKECEKLGFNYKWSKYKDSQIYNIWQYCINKRKKNKEK